MVPSCQIRKGKKEKLDGIWGLLVSAGRWSLISSFRQHSSPFPISHSSSKSVAMPSDIQI